MIISLLYDVSFLCNYQILGWWWQAYSLDYNNPLLSSVLLHLSCDAQPFFQSSNLFYRNCHMGENCFKDNEDTNNNTKHCRGSHVHEELCTKLGENPNWNDSH
jgi:hypothetical protein